MRFFTGFISNMVCFLLWTCQNAVIRAEFYRIRALIPTLLSIWPEVIDDQLQATVAAELVDVELVG